MRNILLAAAAAAAIASPAAARDGSGYVGIEGGLLFPKDISGDVYIDYTAGGMANTVGSDAFDIDMKRGVDIDVIGGYDFGMFRLEGELGWKRAKLDGVEFSDAVADELEDAGFVNEDFDLDGRAKVRSLMGNALIDFGADDGISGFVGAGFGRARVKIPGDTDSVWAGQLLAGVRTAVSPNIDLGLKYRYFRTGKLDFADSQAFSMDIDSDGDLDVGTASIGTNSRFQSHSLLASLIFNFGAPEVAPAPVYTAPPPPPEAPATQTCPDGSVILATDVCPAPPPPPPPAPAGERG